MVLQYALCGAKFVLFVNNRKIFLLLYRVFVSLNMGLKLSLFALFAHLSLEF